MTLSVGLNPVLERFKSNTRDDAMATSLIAPVILTARDTAATPGSWLKSSRLTLMGKVIDNVAPVKTVLRTSCLPSLSKVLKTACREYTLDVTTYT